ncbi:MAG: UDP-N-acetylmuramate dehydrogenase [Planctomycetaceae bacterium]|jgi:UDP-N-acetylmuramate dehydrogenase|nr:UDP-N-acetylmuramate dehydrogenase [Planctomycetaceae bacterium]
MNKFGNLSNSVRQDIFRGVRCDVPLAMYTRLQLGGLADFFAEPESETDLVTLLKQGQINKRPIRILGAGSNLLVTESGVTGLVIRFSNPAFCGITIEGQHVIAGAGAKLGQVITQSVSQGLGGIEDLIGIPGTVGGALLGNAGTNSGDLGQWVESVRVADIDGEISVLSKNEISFGYRSSSLDDVIILAATLRLEKEDLVELAKRMQKLWIVRKTQQPGGELASVHVFKNPSTGTPAGDLIEQSGLKGTRIGGAVVSERNANFIMVEPEGTADDVLRLIRFVQEQVEIVAEIRLELSLEVW